MTMKPLFKAMVLSLLAIFGSVGAFAQDRIGQPQAEGLWLQEPASEQAQRIGDFNYDLLIIITVISIVVFVLMGYIMVRYSARVNPTPSKVSHNTLLEVVWTVIPIFILIGIGVVSIPLLYWQETIPETEFAIQVNGNQWNWTYQYPDHGGIEFTSVLVPDAVHADAALRAEAEADLTAFLGRPAQLNARLLDTDNRLVVPVNTKVKLLITATDVLHAWTIPAFGVKMDAVPGRVNETWFEVRETGTFYGQCSELCGKDHAFMPIAVEVVSKEEFARWIEHAKQDYAVAPSARALGR